MNMEQYISKLTLEEKAALLQGWTTWTTRDVPRLEIPAIFLTVCANRRAPATIWD